MESRSYQYPLFHVLPPSVKVLYTSVLVVLGFGYSFGLVYIWESHAGRDGRPGVSVKDIQIAYRGNPEDSRLEAALKGPMSGMLPKDEAKTIIGWVRTGAHEDGYKTVIEPIISQRCVGCHNGSNPNIPNLTSLSEIKKVTETDHGVDLATLIRVSHIHLFGLTFIFGAVGMIFSHAYVPWRNVKSLIVVIPFLCIFVDIASWWLTKVSAVFGYTVLISGALMGLSFAFQWFVSVYQMWVFKCPPGEVCPVD